MRVYWPTTLTALAAATTGPGPLATAPVTVHAVTALLRDYYADADPRDLEEELEYAAMNDAAEQSLRLLASAPVGTPPRRVVLALEVPDGGTPGAGASWTGPDRSQVVLDHDLTVAELVSVHVDDAEAEADVRAAVAALGAADAGSEDASFTVESAQGNELLWYDATELPLLLAVGT